MNRLKGVKQRTLEESIDAGVIFCGNPDGCYFSNKKCSKINWVVAGLI
jgi:hypothetical protein